MPIEGGRRPSFVRSCGHRAGVHFNTKERPNGPCRECRCQAFTPEPLCRCGHGRKRTRRVRASRRTSADVAALRSLAHDSSGPRRGQRARPQDAEAPRHRPEVLRGADAAVCALRANARAAAGDINVALVSFTDAELYGGMWLLLMADIFRSEGDRARFANEVGGLNEEEWKDVLRITTMVSERYFGQ